MPVRVCCPHCRTFCLVAEQHRGVPLKCGRCGGTFTTRADPKATMACAASAPRVRLDIGAAGSSPSSRQGSEDIFLVQHLVYCNLEERHELAVLAATDRNPTISALSAALAPLLDKIVTVASNNNPAAAVETLVGACKDLASTLALAVIWDGLVSMRRIGTGSIYHQSGGRLNRLTGDRCQLAAGDWLILAASPHPFPANTLQAEIAAACSDAVELAQRLSERAGGEGCTFIAVSAS